MADLRLMCGDSSAIKHVIFIHGLGGNVENTWQSNNLEKIFWPTWLHEDLENICIWSVGYEAPKLSFLDKGMGLQDRAQSILETLLAESALGEGELLLVGHSLGGLIIKQLLRLASDQTGREDTSKLINRVSGVAFLGTPHTGADMAQTGNSLTARLLLKFLLLKPSAATASLERNDSNLRALNTWYRGWYHEKGIRHLVLSETKPFLIFGQIVKPDSADPGLKDRVIPIDAHHINISKPTSKDDVIYKHIKNFVAKKTLTKQARWLQANFGKDHSGWIGYGNWANSPKGVEEEYIIDSSARLHRSSSSDSKGLTTVEALNHLRNVLYKSGASVRLVGLSGVGKTRFAQALFDERVGENALNKETVFYSDISLTPLPTPTVLVERLVKEQIESIIIVDNCAPDLHRELTNLCKYSSAAKILTVEYDVREDLPEQTEVYNLDSSSSELIETMISSRFPQFSKQTAAIIANFSGGNARVAIALASNIEHDENLSRLKDEELFKRLFHQRHDSDTGLEKAAEGLSLVYSFLIESEDDFSHELKLLSDIVMMPPNEMYKFAKELKRRGLAQERGVWMALLPNPIANKLASLALQNIPFSNIVKFFNSKTEPRLIKSFSRRLGYLKGSRDAAKLASSWISSDGVIDLLFRSRQEDLACTLLANIAPIIPAEVLFYIENKGNCDQYFLSRDNPHYASIARLLRSLAYESQLFCRCFELLCCFALSEKKDEANNSVRSLLSSFFQLYLSGTHATLEQRVSCVKKLIYSSDLSERELGYELLDNSLNTQGFSSSYGFDFGVESRDFGSQPKTNKDILSWYREFLLIIHDIALSEKVVEQQIKDVFAGHIRELWRISSLHNEIATISKSLSRNGGWPGGWTAFGEILRFDSSLMTNEQKVRLETLRACIEVQDLDGRMELYVLTSHHDFFYLDELDDEGETVRWGYEKALEMAKELGEYIVQKHIEYLYEKLEKILSTKSTTNHLIWFGQGVASGLDDAEQFWKVLVNQLENLDVDKVNTNFLQGFIKHTYDIQFDKSQLILDDLLHSDKINKIFPLVQSSSPVDESAVSRLIISLKNRTSPSWMYLHLASGGRHELVSDSDLISILNLLWLLPDGHFAVFQILTMRFHSLDSKPSYTPSKNFLKKCREFLLIYGYGEKQANDGRLEHSLVQVAKAVFTEAGVEEEANALFRKLSESIATNQVYAFNYGKFLSTVITLQPTQALEVFFQNEYVLKQITTSNISQETSPFSKLPCDIAIEWCKELPIQRFKTLASSITPFEEHHQHTKLTVLAKALVNECPEPRSVIEAFERTISPMSWSGSRAYIIEQRMNIFEELTSHQNPEVVESSKIVISRIRKRIMEERAWEELNARTSEERFEW